MDDPLVSLTIYESKLNKSKNTTVVRQKIPPSTTSSTSKKNQPSKASEKSKGPSNKSNRTRKIGGVAQSIHRSEEKPSGECFPCLPGIEDDKEMSLSSDSSDVASPTHIADDRVSQDASSSGGPLNSPLPPPPQDFWLMRLFQSNLFNMSIAIGYLFNSKEEDVQAYLGNKLFVSVCSCDNYVVICTILFGNSTSIPGENNSLRENCFVVLLCLWLWFVMQSLCVGNWLVWNCIACLACSTSHDYSYK